MLNYFFEHNKQFSLFVNSILKQIDDRYERNGDYSEWDVKFGYMALIFFMTVVIRRKNKV